MNYYKAVFDLGRPVEVKIPEEKDILQKMQADPRFATPPVAYADLQSALELQDTTLANAQFGGLANTEALRVQVAAVDDIIRQLKLYVDAVALGRTDVILASGFRHTKPRTPVGDMSRVTNVRVLDNQKEGEVWNMLDPIAPKKQLVGGLKSATYYWFEMRGIGRKGPGPWSDPAKGLAA